MNPTQEREESLGEKLELQIQSKQNQNLEFSIASKFSIMLKPVHAWKLSLARVVTDTRNNSRVFEPVFTIREKILILPKLLQNL